MSYCRFSTDDYTCDLYVYDDAGGGVTVHVAGSRYLYRREDLPPVVPLTDATIPQWTERHRRVSQLVEKAERVRITLPHAGESRYNLDPEDAVAFLRELQDLGYHFPAAVIAAIEDEHGD